MGTSSLPSGQSALPSAAKADGHIRLIVSVDTEEDNWTPTRYDASVENIRALPRFQAMAKRAGIRPTYFCAYQPILPDWSAAIIRDLHESGDCEVAAHLHAWNTPPLSEPLVLRNTMLNNLPADLQLAKLRVLTDRMTEVLGTPPSAFRTGRFGLGPETIPALLACGYRVDSSVTPYWNWGPFDGGPNFEGAPLQPYRLGERQDPRIPSELGELVEIPVSLGFTRRPFAFWSRIHAALSARPLLALRAPGIASRMGVIRKVVLSPENDRLSDMLALSQSLVATGVPHLNLFFHSSSLIPGLSPYTRSAGDVDHLLDTVESYVDKLRSLIPVRCVTVTEAATDLMPIPQRPLAGQ